LNVNFQNIMFIQKYASSLNNLKEYGFKYGAHFILCQYLSLEFGYYFQFASSLHLILE
jgi:hypothetical protein